MSAERGECGSRLSASRVERSVGNSKMPSGWGHVGSSQSVSGVEEYGE
jgi:hypothetical protein